MAQHDYNIANQSGADFRADLNNALLAIATVNSGATEPSTTFAHQLWVDTASSVLKIRNAADNAWITTGVSITASNTFTGDLTGNVTGNLTGNVTGNVTGDLTGNADSADILSTARTISLSGDVVGSVSFDGSANVDIDTVVQINSITLGTDTTGDYVESLSGGTGVTVTGGTGEGSTPSVAIGQAVATTDNVTFNLVTATDEFVGDIDGAIRFTAKADEALSKGDVVYVSGVSGNTTTVGKAKADDASKMPAFGMAIEDANANNNLQIVTFGNLTSIDTSNESVGEILYVSTTAGEYTTTPPTGESAAIQNIGKVLRSHAVNGSIKVGGAGRSNATGNLNEGNIFIGNASNQSSTATLDTSIVVENTNLYYTTTRANTDFDTRLATKDTGDLTEGSNLYYTTARVNSDFDTRLATKSTTDLAEGTNLYYTSARFDSAFTSKDTDDLSEGSTNLYYTTARFDSAFGNKTTSDLTEGTNLYYTDTRANSAIDTRVTKAFVDALGIQASSVDANSVTLGTDTVGNYVATVTGTANKITVTGSGSESANITLTLPDDVQIADSLTVAGNLTVNGTLTSLDTTNLDIEDNLFQLNAGLTGSPVNDSGMLINRGDQDNGIFMWDESVDKFTLGLTTADGSATGNITLNSLGTLVANIEGDVTGAVTGTVSSLSNHDTGDLTEGSNLYYTQARFDSAFTAKSTSDLSEGSNLYYTDARFDTRLATKDTDDVSEGTSNLYYTTARFDSAFGGKSTSDLSEGTNLYYTSARANSDFDTRLATKDTGDLAEGSNLYYTDARVQAVSINNVVEDTTPQLGGNLDLNSSDITGTGDINITGTVTADGLTVDGASILNATDNATNTVSTGLKIGHKTSGTTANGFGSALEFEVENSTYSTIPVLAKIESVSTNEVLVHSDLNFYTKYNNILQKRMSLNNGGDISFYEDTGTTAKLFWDASAESLGIGTTSPSNYSGAANDLVIAGSGQKGMTIATTDGSQTSIFFADSDSGTGEYAGAINYFHSDDHLEFYTASAERMRIDSAGRVGIGITSPEAKLHVLDNTAIIGNASSGYATINFHSATTNSARYGSIRKNYDSPFDMRIRASNSEGEVPLIFENSNDSEAMRIDASGNLLVGRTSNFSGAKAEIQTSDDVTTLTLNKNNVNDGEILRIAKSGSTIGGIGNNGDNLGIESVDVGLLFLSGSSQIIPTGGNFGVSDGTKDLGRTTTRFKDLYLSGAVKVGSYATELLDGGLKFKFNGGAFIDQNTVGQPLTFRVSNASSIDTTTMTLNSSGNVGIGTSSPDNNKLVIADSSDVGIQITKSGVISSTVKSVTTGLAFGVDTSSGNTERMRIDSSGNVGIGTTSPSSFYSGSRQLVVGSGSGEQGITLYAGNASTSYLLFADGTSGAELYAGQVNYSHANNALGFCTNGITTPRMTIDSSGNVGIGTSSPSHPLIVSRSGTGINSFFTNTTDADFGINLGSGITLLTPTTGTLAFGTSSTERMRIDSSGDVGIGLTNGNHRLQVLNDKANFAVTKFTSTSASTTEYGISLNLTNDPNDATRYFLSCAGGVNGRAIIYANGNIANTNNSYTGISDLKLKENIVDAGSQWDDIKALRVRKYSFKEENTAQPTQIGVIAQEVEAAGMAGLVYESPDQVTAEDGTIEDTGEVTKTVKYSILYMKSVKALQEAMERIETLEAKVQTLENN